MILRLFFLVNTQSYGVPVKYSFCSKRVLANRIGYSPHTLKAIRHRGDWIEGIHYVRQNSRTILYNLELCLNWLANQATPSAHQRAIECYLASLVGEKPRVQGRRSPVNN